MSAAVAIDHRGYATGPLNGRQKAAAFLINLGPEAAAHILKFLPEAEVEQLSAEMAAIWRVEPDTGDAVWHEMAERLRPGNQSAVGGLDYAREVLEHLLGAAKADEIVGTLTAKGELRPFDFLRRQPADQIRAFLQDEAPQTVALVIASVWSGLGGRILAELPPETQAEVGLRIATMCETNPQVVADIDRGLRQKLSAVATHEFASPGGVDALAQILNSAGRSAERNVLEIMGERDPHLADEVRMRMFTFEDLISLEDREIQLVLREIDPKDLVLALRGVGPDLAEKILSNMSQRAAETLREDMEVQPPQRRAVVEEAQGKIVAVVRRLEEAAALTLRESDDPADQVL